MLGIIRVITCGALMLSLAACKPDAGAETRGEEGRARKELEQRLLALEGELKSRPQDFPELRIKARVIAEQAGLIAPEVADRVKELLRSSEAAHKDAAQKALEALKNKVGEGLIAGAKERDAVKAKAAFARLQTEVQGFPPHYSALHGREAEELRRKLSSTATALERCREVMTKAQRMREINFYESAIGTLESFLLVKAFHDSPYAKTIEQDIEETKRLNDEWQKKKAEEDKKPWEVIYSKALGLTNLKINTMDSVNKEKTDIIEVDHKAEIPISLICGDPAWADIIVEIEFRIIRGGLNLGVRMSADEQAFDILPLTEPAFARLSWHRVQVTVRGDTARVVSFENFEVKEVKLERGAGKIGIAIEDKAKVQIRALRVKVLRKENEAAPKEGAKDGEKDNAEKGEPNGKGGKGEDEKGQD